MDMYAEGKGVLENFFCSKRMNMAEALIPSHAREGSILDVGCDYDPYFLSKTNFKDKHGIDWNVNKNHPNKSFTLKKFDLINEKKFPYKANTFDVVTMLAVFEHLPHANLRNVLSEVHRVLKPGGRFIMTTPSFFGNEVLKVMAVFGIVNNEKMKEHVAGYGGREIKGFLAQAGFTYDKINHGTFELGCNNWVRARKS